MERQYIGARYVPKFANPIEWQEGATYEALTIVTYMGASYTSKKAVPAGIKPTDNRYWVVTGNYNAQVEEYRQQTVAVKNDFDKKFKRKWLFLGDSYDVHSGWVNKLVGFLRLGQDDYWNLSVSGHGFKNSMWLNDLKSWVNSHPNEVKNIGRIVIGGGLNDSNGSVLPVLDSLINEFGVYCENTFDDAVVNLAYFGWEIDSYGSNHVSTPKLRESCQYRYSRAGGFHGVTYLNGCESATHARHLMENDGYHPNHDGGWQIAVNMYNAIMTGGASAGWPENSITINPVAGTIYNFSKQSLHDNSVYTTINIRIDDLNATVGFDDVEIADIVMPFSNTFPEQYVMAIIKLNDGTYINELVKLSVSNDKLMLGCRGINEGKNGHSTIQVNRIVAAFFTVHSAVAD